MTQQPNCPHCKSQKFCVVTHTLDIGTNQADKTVQYYRQVELLCCDRCGAVLGQFNPALIQRKEI